MMDLIRSIVIYALVVVLIVVFAMLFKMSDRVTVEPTDHSIEESGFGGGGYRVKPTNDYKGGEGGDVVAYWLPGAPGTSRVARVLAVGGEKVEMERKNPSDPRSPVVVKVNGKPARGFQIDNVEWRFPEILVPRGCLFLLADKSSAAQDSMNVGPVPLYCVRGKVN